VKKYFLEQTIYYKKQIESRKEIMAISYTYPRVDVITKALQRQTYTQTVDDTLVLFAPFKAAMGPMDEIIRIHSLGEFEETYGAITYSEWGQTGLNIRNWLENGGTVYAMRHDLAEVTGTSKYNDNDISATNHPAYAPYGLSIGGRYTLSIDVGGIIEKISTLMGTEDDTLNNKLSKSEKTFIKTQLQNVNDLNLLVVNDNDGAIDHIGFEGTLPVNDFNLKNFELKFCNGGKFLFNVYKSTSTNPIKYY
jgi:hypothetical protein